MLQSHTKFRVWRGTSSSGTILLAAWLAGCAATTGLVGEDRGDACADQRAELRSAKDYYANAIVAGAVTGAAVGLSIAKAKAMLGHGDKDKKKEAVKGAVTGAVAGAIGGYYLARQKNARDLQSLAESIRADIVADNAEISRAKVAFGKLKQCRFGAAQAVKADYAAGRIAREEAVRRLGDLRQRFDADLAIADDVGARMANRSKEFSHAANELIRQDPEAPTAVQVSKLADTNQVAQNAYLTEVEKTKAEVPATFGVEGKVSQQLPVCVG